MNENMPDQPRDPRHEIPLQATLQMGGVIVPCRVHNISASGVLVEAQAHLRIGDLTIVKLADFGAMAGRVVRVSSTTAGIAFEDGAEAMDAFIIGWQALEQAIAAGSQTEPADERNHQVI